MKTNSLIFLDASGATTIPAIRSLFNGSKYLHFKSSRGEGYYAVFPDFFTHADVMMFLVSRLVSKVHEDGRHSKKCHEFLNGFDFPALPEDSYSAVSAGAISCNPTHPEEAPVIHGGSASLQLRPAPDDLEAISSICQSFIRNHVTP